MNPILLFIQSIEDESKQKLLEDVYHHYYSYMLAVAHAILRDGCDYQDAVQIAFYNIATTADHFSEIGSQQVDALINVYTRNAAINIYNQNKRFSDRYVALEEMGGITEHERGTDDLLDMMIEHEDYKALRRAVCKMEPMYRDVIQLKYYHYFTNREIAAALQLDTNTVNNRLFRAKKLLRKLLEDEGYVNNATQ